MSKRLSGINPLSYMGVEPYTPPAMYKNGRAPTSTDSVGYNLGDFWLEVPPGYIGPERLYVLISLNMGLATWVQLYPGSASTIQFETESGTVNPAGGIVNVFGDGTNITTSGAGNTITITLDADIADEYVTDAGTANPSSGTLNIIGGSNINTAGASNTVTVNLDTSVNIPGTLTVAMSAAFGSDVIVNNFTEGVVQSDSMGFLFCDKGTNGQVLIGSTAGAPAWANLTSTGATVTITNNANSINLESAAGGGNTIVSQFTSNGTWTKNGSTQYVEVYVINAGGGGAGGGQAGSGGVNGGGGGGSWGSVHFEGPEFCFGATEPVLVGAGGSGGAAATVGANGGISQFGDMTTHIALNNPSGLRNGGGSLVATEGIAYPGYYGDILLDKGVDVLGDRFYVGPQFQSAGNGGGLQNSWNGRAGLPRGVTAVNQGVSVSALSFSSYICGGTGGGGAGFNASSPMTAFTGGNGGAVLNFSNTVSLVAGGAGGQEGGTLNGGAGSDGLTSVGAFTCGSGGGGGGNRAVGGSAGTGGDGGFPGGGGGGGGAGTSAGQGGAGGNGGNGVVIVVEYL